MSPEAIWAIVCGFCFVAEIFTVSFLLFIPGLAALICFLLALFNLNTTIQIIVFVVLTTIMLIFVRPLMKKMFKNPDAATNSDALIGKIGVAIKDIDKDIMPGQVKVAGEVWSAITQDNEKIAANTAIQVVGISGVKLLVKRYEEE